MSEKEIFINAWEREFKTTISVLRSYPESKLDLRPAEKSKTAKDLAWTIISADVFIERAAKGTIQRGTHIPAPSTLEVMTQLYEKIHPQVVGTVSRVPEEDFFSMIKFFTGPGEMGDVPRNRVFWLILSDHIHHRGQFSVYLRLAGGKVPSIYGPTADEPW